MTTGAAQNLPIQSADNLGANINKLYDCLNAKAAPGVIGKPVFQKDLELVKLTGARDMASVFGAKDLADNAGYKPSLNFGSRRSVGMLPDDTRLRLFGLKCLLNAVEIQASLIFKTANPTADQMMAAPLYKHQLEPMLKAFDVADFAQWIPTVNTRFFFEEFEIPTILADLFDTMPMESATVNVPGALGRLFGKLEGDTATFGAQSNTESNYSVTSKNNVVHAQITEDLNQDSAPSIIDKYRREVVKGIARSEERTLLDGDTTGTHMDSDVTASTDFRKAYKGLRKLGLANSANGSVYDHSGDAPSKALFRALLKKMGRFAAEKGDLAWIFGPSVSNDLVTGAIPELFTAFAFGGPASNVTGVVPPVFGIKGYESEYVREDLDSTGVYSNSGDSLTWMALVKRSRFQNWLRQPTRVWAAPALPSSDLMLMTAKKRHAFAGIPQTADEKSLVIAVNVESDT